MKRILVVVALAGALAVLWCSSLFAQWEPDTRLTYNDQRSKTSLPSTWCVASQGEQVHVVWMDDRTTPGRFRIYYKRSDDGGQTWNTDTPLTADTYYALSPSIAVSGSTVHVAWLSAQWSSNFDVCYQRSIDGGQSWPGPIVDLSTDLPPSITLGNPSIAASGQYAVVVWERNSNLIRYNRSDNGGSSWAQEGVVEANNDFSEYPTVALSGSTVHVAWWDWRGGTNNHGVWYRRSGNGGLSWDAQERQITTTLSSGNGCQTIAASGQRVYLLSLFPELANALIYNRSLDGGGTFSVDVSLPTDGPVNFGPSVSASGLNVHVGYIAGYTTGIDDYHYWVDYKHSTNEGGAWDPDVRLTLPQDEGSYKGSLSVASSGSRVHLVWEDDRNLPAYNYEVYYKRNPSGNPFIGFKSDSSNGRHLVRDPNTGYFHMVMTSQDNKVYYTKSVDGFGSWSEPVYLGDGKYPTIGLAYPPEYDQAIPCVAYQPYPTSNYLKYKYLPPGTGGWQDGSIPTPNNPGPPSLIAVGNAETPGSRIYVAFRAGAGYVYCQNFNYNTPSTYVRELMDNTHSNCSQPCLAVDGNGLVYGGWRWVTNNQVWYGRRGSSSPFWSSKLRVDYTNNPSQQPFVECYGDSVFVAWADWEPTPGPSDVWRAAAKIRVPPEPWQYTNVSLAPDSSVSPTQAWREFTTWSEKTTTSWMFDINYWRPGGMTGVVLPNPTEWSYWTHSQMRYPNPGFTTDLWSAWTESPNAGQPPFRVLTNHLSFIFLGPGLGGELSDYGNYYKVLAGQDSPSVYCKKRDGVLRFSDKAVDFARDSLVYELPYLDPVYDYYVRVASYREAGSDWVQGLSVNGGPARTVRFAPDLVDTAWVRVPPVAYERDRKVSFSLKNVRGDYVTGLSLTIFQCDPKRGKGGPQAGEPVTQPAIREVFAVYPNPTTSKTQIEYSLKSSSQVNLSVYDVAGRLVREVVNGPQPAGVHRASWDGRTASGHQAPSGIYFVKLNSPGANKTFRFVVVR